MLYGPIKMELRKTPIFVVLAFGILEIFRTDQTQELDNNRGVRLYLGECIFKLSSCCRGMLVATPPKFRSLRAMDQIQNVQHSLRLTYQMVD